jgi:hypothetical protein
MNVHFNGIIIGVIVCPFVSESQNVFRLRVETVDETLHLFGQLGFARDRGEVPILGGLIKDRFRGLNDVGF